MKPEKASTTAALLATLLGGAWLARPEMTAEIRGPAIAQVGVFTDYELVGHADVEALEASPGLSFSRLGDTAVICPAKAGQYILTYRLRGLHGPRYREATASLTVTAVEGPLPGPLPPVPPGPSPPAPVPPAPTPPGPGRFGLAPIALAKCQAIVPADGARAAEARKASAMIRSLTKDVRAGTINTTVQLISALVQRAGEVGLDRPRWMPFVTAITQEINAKLAPLTNRQRTDDADAWDEVALGLDAVN